MSEETQITLKKRKENPDDGELDITPMIDITFLLLAFFVVVSKMDPQAAVDLPKASYGLSVQDKECVVLIVAKDESGSKTNFYAGRSKDPEIAINGSDPEVIEEAIGSYVQEQLSSHPELTSILVKAEGNVSVGDFETAKRGVANAELSSSRKLYAGIKEEQN